MDIGKAIQFLIQRLLKKLYIILPYTVDGVEEHRFNLLNPLGWIMLLLLSIYTGITSAIQIVVTVVKEALIAEAEVRKPVKATPKPTVKTAKTA